MIVYVRLSFFSFKPTIQRNTKKKEHFVLAGGGIYRLSKAQGVKNGVKKQKKRRRRKRRKRKRKRKRRERRKRRKRKSRGRRSAR